MRISSHTTLERFPAAVPIAGTPGASLFFHSPNRRRASVSAEIRPRPLIISCRNSKNSEECRASFAAQTCCEYHLEALARGYARQQHRRTDVAVSVVRGRTARCRAGDGDKTSCYLQEKFCCRFAVDGDIINHRLNSKVFPEKRRRACWRRRQDSPPRANRVSRRRRSSA